MEGITPRPADPLHFTSHHPESPSTLLFIHGAFGSYHEFQPLLSHLKTYHILIPNLHSYGASAQTSPERPLHLPETSDLVASLIRVHAKDKKAHVIGCSMGASIALDLAARHTDVIDALFVTGYFGFGRTSEITRKLLPYGYQAEQGLERLIPRSVITWAMEGEMPSDEEHGPRKTVASCRAVVDVCSTPVEYGRIQARTLICAATKRGRLVPSDDNVDAAQDAWRGMREGEGREGEAGRSVCVRMGEMRHPWWILRPELFARCVDRWVGYGEVLGEEEGVEVLEGSAAVAKS